MTTEQIEEVYASLPAINCKRKCQESCGPILLSDAEHRRIYKCLGKNPGFHSMAKVLLGVMTKNIPMCPQLKNGECSIYNIRPLVCRLFGLTKKMACPWGCIPDRWLSDEECGDLLKRLDSGRNLK